MTKKEVAQAFLKAAASGDVENAYTQYVAQDFIHHNQYFKGDRQSLMDAMIDAHRNSPNQFIEVKLVMEEGDRVATHSLVQRSDPKALPIAVVHIFRFQGSRIVELWDLGQEILADSPNENGAF